MTRCAHTNRIDLLCWRRGEGCSLFATLINMRCEYKFHQQQTIQTTEKCDCYPKAHWSKSGPLTGTWASSFSQIARDHWRVNNNCCSSHKNAASPTLCFFFFSYFFPSTWLFKFLSLFCFHIFTPALKHNLLFWIFNPAQPLCSRISIIYHS